MSNPIILAIETATSQSSVCLAINNRLSHAPLNIPETQASALVPAIETLLAANGIWYDNLTHLVTTIGPGSFTGIRIGLSVARTIAFAHRAIEIHPVTTLACLAAGYHGDATLLHVALRAGKGEIYYQSFECRADTLHPSRNIEIVKPNYFLTFSPQDVVIGNAADLMPDAISFQFQHPNTPQAADLITALKRIEPDADLHLRPLYIRAPDAKLPTKPYV